MKLLFYFGGFAKVGGIETFCKNLLCYLRSKYYDCELICWGESSPLLEFIEQAGVKVTRNSWQWGCRWNLPDWLLLILGFEKIKQADVVLFGKLFPNYLVKQLRVKADCCTKFVYITPYQPLPLAKTQDKKLLETLNCFDLILVQADLFREELRQIGYQGKVEVIPYIPQEVKRFYPLSFKEELKIGFLGRFVEDKNIAFLLQVFHCFQEKYSKEFGVEQTQIRRTSLHLFGDGPLRKDLEQLVEKLDIQPSVIFHGNIPNSEIVEAISSCHIFAFTSRIEGQCLAALEILSCGRPIVANRVGAFPEILADSRLGRIVHSDDPDDFANHLLEIARFIQQQKLTEESIRSAYLERYSPEIIGDRYHKLFQTLIPS
jgi:glycosyltransferase involved in cell wall biosynthesis